MSAQIVWFRRDARLAYNPAWSAAADAGTICALFVIDPLIYSRVSARRREYLVGGLRQLDRALTAHGGRLRIEQGDPATTVPRVAKQLGASSVHVNREVSPFGLRRDREVARQVALVVHEGTYVQPPGSLLTTSGTPYRVFTPFFRAWSSRPVTSNVRPSNPAVLDETGVGLPHIEAVGGVGEAAARVRLDEFARKVGNYGRDRDRPDLEATSRLSIDLKYGWLSPSEAATRIGGGDSDRSAFVRQLAWRDFYGHLLASFPDSVTQSMRPEYRGVDWATDDAGLAAWKSGTTGYPIVDAGMRELRETGWLNNRVRLITASFLIKDLLIDWQEGERWFRRHLLDADTAQNVGNWQWVAGTGADAAPYFRVFNPVSQSRKFDPHGRYVRRWVPELTRLPDAVVHAPWEAEASVLESAGVQLGVTYPLPIVDHAEARIRAIETYERAKAESA